MTISSRTPEGLPHVCPICGGESRIEPSFPAGDSPCPRCGHLLWWFQQRIGDHNTTITAELQFIEDLKKDSMDIVEMMMEMEDEFDFSLPDEEYQSIRTVGDLIRRIREQD